MIRMEGTGWGGGGGGRKKMNDMHVYHLVTTLC